MSENFDLIEYHGFKGIFIGLYKGKNEYYIVYGKTLPAKLNYYEDCKNVYGGFANAEVSNIALGKEININIPFVGKTTFCSIENRSEYNTLVDVLENLL